ncbi:TerB N-terminal domain-containing protein [Paenibacillus sp. PsM32]|uniref:TerB N-terminal domain-containing protein n=1 Tax=Paenibacillus sp. PsM32 TaxID=3030536 RepID=UPI00263ABAD5|nr:TerB N-terminal domain-containing protein [Paenibacillus sp. PsM32]MDN4619217.1 TerB N-terminal domain-containing protein [Paenibacillus sp. PsM32]
MHSPSPLSYTDRTYTALLSFEEDRGFFLHISRADGVVEEEQAEEVQQMVMGKTLRNAEHRWQHSSYGHSECLLKPEEAHKLYTRLTRLVPGTLELFDGTPIEASYDGSAEAVLSGGSEPATTIAISTSSESSYTVDDLDHYLEDVPDEEIVYGIDPAYAQDQSFQVAEEYIPYAAPEEFTDSIHMDAKWVLEGRRDEKNGVGQVTAVPMIEISGIRYPAVELSRRLGASGTYVGLHEHGQIEADVLRELGLGPMGRMADGTSLDKNSKLTSQEIIQRGSERLSGPWEQLLIPDLALPGTERDLAQHFDFLTHWGISGGILGGVMKHSESLQHFLEAYIRKFPACKIAIIGKKPLLTALQKLWQPTLESYWQEASELSSKTSSTKNKSTLPLMAVPASLLTGRTALLPGGVDIAIYLEPDELTDSVTSKVYKAMNKLTTRLRLAIYAEGQHLDEPHMRTAQTSLLKLFHSVVREYAIVDPDHPLTELPPAFPMVVKRALQSGLPQVSERKGGFAEFEWGTEERGLRIPERPADLSIPTMDTTVDEDWKKDHIIYDHQGWLQSFQYKKEDSPSVTLPPESTADPQSASEREQDDISGYEMDLNQPPTYKVVHSTGKSTSIPVNTASMSAWKIPPIDVTEHESIYSQDQTKGDIAEVDSLVDHRVAHDNHAQEIVLDSELAPRYVSYEDSSKYGSSETDEELRSQSSIQTAEHVFAKRAHEMIEHREEEAEFVPFMSYWPTYESMTWRQKKWYFYWRQEVREGRYPATDLSYIFLMCYEIINGAGWTEPLEGHQYLMNLWRQYRKKFIKLDRYIPQWVLDFGQVHDLHEPLSEFMIEASDHLPTELADLEWERIWSAQPAQIPFALVHQLLDYDMQRSRFYVEKGSEWIQEYVPKVLAAVDAFLDKQQGARLIQIFRPPVYRETERYLFRSAVYDATIYGRTVTVRRLPLCEHKPLREFLTGIIKLTENEFRRHLEFSGRLRINPPVEPEIARLIERYIKRIFTVPEELPAPRQVQIDTSVLEQLQADSNVVRDMLTLREEQKISNEEEWTTWIAEHALAVDADPPLVEEESGIDTQQDTLQSVDDGEQTLPAQSSLPQDQPTEEMRVSIAPLPAELDNEWQEWIDGLQTHHIQFLGALLDAADDSVLRDIASKGGTMPALLVDEINDLAMDTIGDLLLEEGTIMEEYRTVLDAIIMR